MSSRWMGVRFVGCFDILLGSGDEAKSWNFLESYLFLVGWVIWVQRSVQSLVVTACFERLSLSGWRKSLGRVV